VRDLPPAIATMSERLTALTADQATAQGGDGAILTIPAFAGTGQAAGRNEVLPKLAQALDALPARVNAPRRFPLGRYRGLYFGMILHPDWRPEVYLEGAILRKDTLSREHHGPRAVLNALERLANGYAAECSRVRQDLAIAESQLRDYQARLGKPFAHEEYLSELTSLRDRLKAGLSATAQGDDAREAFPSWPPGSRRSRPPTPSKPRRNAPSGSTPPPRNP